MKPGTRVWNCVSIMKNSGFCKSRRPRRALRDYYEEIEMIEQDINEMLNEITFIPDNSIA